jgi:uncharacterized protein (DUF2336 family)
LRLTARPAYPVEHGASCIECIKAYRVSSSDFRQIAIRSESGKGERLFRAAISAFCSLTRPSRAEIAQIEDLTLSLFNGVSVESRRYVAAALSECEYPPAALVRRLCEEPVDIAAPLLIRSNALTDVDLVALIGRHGLPHARAIARRKDLNPAIADLIKALERPTLVRSTVAAPDRANAPGTVKPIRNEAVAPRIVGEAAETARHRLRAIMAADQGSGAANLNAPAGSTYVKLRETALTGNAAFFQTALADALDLDFATARSFTESASYSSLLVALRALDLGEDKAFLITVAVFPLLFPHPQAIRIFLDRYRTLHRDVALQKVDEWKAASLAGAVHQIVHRPANADTRAPARTRRSSLKAS